MKAKKFKWNARAKRTCWCYLILSTQIIGLVAFTIYPTLWAAAKAFYCDVQIPSRLRFVGLENFIRIFTQDKAYWQTWINTFIFALGKLPLELPLAMLVAICVTRESIKGKGFVRAIVYLPAVVGVSVVGIIMHILFQYFGFINNWLLELGVINEAIDWYSSKGTAMWMLIIGSIWRGFGTNTLYFIGALNNVPKELYESAKIDGAGAWKLFTKIQLPMMAPVLTTVLLLTLNATLHVGDYVLATTNGAPFGSTYTVVAYRTANFVQGFGAESTIDIGYGSAICVVTSILMIIIALIYRKLTERAKNLY